MASEMVDRAVQIVKKMLEKNMGISDIKAKLLGVGISEADIQEILTRAGAVQKPAPQPEQVQKPAMEQRPVIAVAKTAQKEKEEEEHIAEPLPLMPEAVPSGIKEALSEIKAMVAANRSLTKELLETTREVLMRLEQMVAVGSLARSSGGGDELVSSSEGDIKKMLMKDLQDKLI
jgi:hypothetical protein